MADTTVDAAVDGAHDLMGGPHQFVYTAPLVGYYIYGASNFLVYRKTTDGGLTWAAEVSISTGTNSPDRYDCWYDKWTSGDTGTEIHMCWHETSGTNEIRYRSLDTSGDTLGTVVIVEATTLQGTTQYDEAILSFTKARGGNLYAMQWENNAGGHSFWRGVSPYGSSDWTERTSGADGSAPDVIELHPGNEADNQDIYMLYIDRSAGELSLKTFDESGNSWSEVSLDASVTADSTGDYLQMSGAVRHSDDHLLVAYWNDHDTSTADLRTIDITSASVNTQKTNIVDNLNEAEHPCMIINQQNSDVYVFFAKGSGILHATTDVVYYVSTDDMTGWGTEQAYSETNDDNRTIHGTMSIGDDGGRIQPGFYNDDLRDLFVNLVNDIEIAAAGGGGGRIMGALAGHGGLAGPGGIAGKRGGITA